MQGACPPVPVVLSRACCWFCRAPENRQLPLFFIWRIFDRLVNITTSTAGLKTKITKFADKNAGSCSRKRQGAPLPKLEGRS
ncbi:hypothetical protein NXC14_CH03512 [Rhizobium sp. NXC14]|nr:hypothetical protein NXC14_CH03512 [Rhizobium sp. NXC14]